VLGSFGFPGEAADRRVGDLSGGERTRLALAVCMANPVNLLVLDEPTNHLDLPSCDVLEDALSAYPGTVLLVSHDRHLIRAVAHDLVEVRDGVVRRHHGVDESVLTPMFSGGTAGPGPTARGAAAGSGPRSAANRTTTRNVEETRGQVARNLHGSHGALSKNARQQLRKEVNRLERELTAAEGEVADLNRQLSDPAVFGDPEKVTDLSRRFGEAKDRSSRLMDEWAEASSKLESTGSS
jgi:ATP-binding cassette subfamily F protein 3